jgi:hypothetical protein
MLSSPQEKKLSLELFKSGQKHRCHLGDAFHAEVQGVLDD